MGLFGKKGGAKDKPDKKAAKKGKPAETKPEEEVDFKPEEPKPKPAAKAADPRASWKRQQQITSTWRAYIDKLASENDLSDPKVREKVRATLEKDVFLPLVKKFGLKDALACDLLAGQMLGYLNDKIPAPAAKPKKKEASKAAPAPAEAPEDAAGTESVADLEELGLDLEAEAGASTSDASGGDASSGDASSEGTSSDEDDLIADALNLDGDSDDDVGIGTEELDGDGTADLSEEAAKAGIKDDSDLQLKGEDDDEELTLEETK